MLIRLPIRRIVSDPSSSASRRPVRQRRGRKRPIAEKDEEIVFLPPTVEFCTVSPAQANLLARQKRSLLLSVTGKERTSLSVKTHLHDCSSGQTENLELQIISPSLSEIIVEFHDGHSLQKALRRIQEWDFVVQRTHTKAKASRLAQSKSRNPRYYYKHDDELANLEELLRNFFNTRDSEKITEMSTDLESTARPIDGELTIHENSRPWLRKLGIGKSGFKAQSISCRPQDRCELCSPAHGIPLDENTT